MVMSGTGTLTNNTDEWWWRVKNPNTEWGTQQGWRNTDSRHQTAARIRNANRNRELGTVCEDIDNDLTMERRNWWVFEGAWMSCSWHCQRGSAEALISGDGSVTPTHIYTHTHHNSNTGREGSNELVNRDSVTFQSLINQKAHGRNYNIRHWSELLFLSLMRKIHSLVGNEPHRDILIRCFKCPSNLILQVTFLSDLKMHSLHCLTTRKSI